NEVFHWIRVKSLDGPAREFRSSGEQSGPTWSPDGQRVAAVSRANWSSPEDGIWVMDTASHAEQLVSSHSVYGVAWSPSEDIILYSDGGLLYVVSLQTRQSTPIFASTPAWHPAWGSAGIAYVHDDHIWVSDEA